MKRVVRCLVYSCNSPSFAERCDSAVRKRGWQLCAVREDSGSGSEWQRVLGELRSRAADAVVVWSFESLAPTLDQVFVRLDQLDGAKLLVVSESIVVSGETRRVVECSMRASRRLLSLERSAAIQSGVRAAADRGKHVGRPRVSVADDAIARIRDGSLTIEEVARLTGLHPVTVKRRLKKACT